MLSHEKVWAAIDALAEQHSLSASGLAKRAGLDSTAFNKSKRQASDGRPRWPSTESLSKIMLATGASLEDFVRLVVGRNEPADTSSAVPLIGMAQAGADGHYDDAGFPTGQGWDMIDLPTLLPQGGYAVEVQGDSMLPLYRQGDRLIVDPNATVRKGDRVVVKTTGGEVMVKVLAKQSAKAVELHSLNPQHADRTIPTGEVEWVARIVWASQ